MRNIAQLNPALYCALVTPHQIVYKIKLFINNEQSIIMYVLLINIYFYVFCTLFIYVH